MRYLIGIDIGTSAAKTVLMEESGKICSHALFEYTMSRPDNGWAEQNPQDWKKAVLNTLERAVSESGVPKEDIKAIGLSGQMHGLVMLDEKGCCLRSSITGCDQRSEEQVDEMLSLLPAEKWLELTANPPIAAWTAAKILWIRKHEPKLYKKCRHILLPKDYIRYILTGTFATDVSDASGMQLLDVKNRCWSKEVLNALNISESMLGKVYESQEITGTVLPEIARQCGISEQTVVVAGAADNAAAAIGTGVVKEGQAFTSIGTSAVIYTHLDQYVQIPEGSLYMCCCAVPGCYFTMGGPQAAGLSLEWFKVNYCQDYRQKAREQKKSVYDLINQAAAGIPAGSERLIFMPYLMGEKTPHMNPRCRGAFVGLNIIHTKAHMLRAIMEGIAHSLTDCNNILKSLGRTVTDMKVCGGGSKSPVWRQIMADLYDCRISTLTQEEGPAYGAAILAGAGCGVFESIADACEKFIGISGSVLPEPENIVLYAKYHALYDRLYEHMKEDFNILYEIR